MQIRLTEAEYEAIERKFRNSGLKSRSEFIRTMIFEGYLILINEDELKKLNQLIYNVANNINQIAVGVCSGLRESESADSRSASRFDRYKP